MHRHKGNSCSSEISGGPREQAFVEIRKKPFCQFHKMFSSINLILLWGFLLLNYSVALESSPGFLSRMHPTLLLRYSVSENIPEGGVVSDFSDNSVHVSLKSWTLCT